MLKLTSIATSSKVLPLRLIWIPEKIGALGLEEIAFLTVLTALASWALSQENCMRKPPLSENSKILKDSRLSSRGCEFVQKS